MLGRTSNELVEVIDGTVSVVRQFDELFRGPRLRHRNTCCLQGQSCGTLVAAPLDSLGCVHEFGVIPASPTDTAPAKDQGSVCRNSFLSTTDVIDTCLTQRYQLERT